MLLTSNLSRFRTQEEILPSIKTACDRHEGVAAYREIGTSEEGRPLVAVIMGHGPQTVSLLAGAHSDEPVGPETLRTFILEGLSQPKLLKDWFEQFTFVVIPHINPDGEAKNRAWMRKWPEPGSYLAHRFRELPGRDLEFGYPSMRPENEAVSEFLEEYAPFAFHMSLHGMGMSEGALLLIERHWIDRTQNLRDRFREMARTHGLRLHDHDRGGEKGFVYIGPGFTTTPEGRAMQDYFLEQDDEEMAAKFHRSSMEFVRSLGGDPLCLVTEFPLYVIGKTIEDRPKGQPLVYLELKDRLPDLTLKAQRGESVDNVLDEYQIRPLSLNEAVGLQLKTMELGLQQIP